MNQDKIKEAFQVWGTDQDGDKPLPEGPAYETWLACAEWMMSQASNQKLLQHEASSYAYQAAEEIEYNSRTDDLEYAYIDGYNAAKLSSMKELAEKDKKIGLLNDGLDHYVSEASVWHRAAKKHFEELTKLRAFAREQNKIIQAFSSITFAANSYEAVNEAATTIYLAREFQTKHAEIIATLKSNESSENTTLKSNKEREL